jgi:hypothetical protein
MRLYTSFLIFTLFHLLSYNFYAQVKLEIRDSITKKPLPYVGVWTSSNSNSVSTDKFGTALISDSLSIIIYTNGYNLKKIDTIREKVIYLSKKEVLTSNNTKRKKKEKIVLFDNFKKNADKSLFLSKNKNFTSMEAFLISCQRCKEKMGFLKDIELSLMNMSEKEAVFKLRFFEVKNNLSIGDEITTPEDVIIAYRTSVVNYPNTSIVKPKNNTLNTKIDLENYSIPITDKGIFIAFETISIPNNKFTLKGQLNSFELLMPTIYYEENDGINFSFKNGQWEENDNDNPIPIMKIRAVLSN